MEMPPPLQPQGSPKGGQDVHYQLRVTLFDRNHQQFFGKTWKSRAEKMKNSRISFTEVRPVGIIACFDETEMITVDDRTRKVCELSRTSIFRVLGVQTLCLVSQYEWPAPVSTLPFTR